MLERVRIQDFKAIRDLTIDLEQFTVIVGGNGAGKTTVLQAIYCADFSYQKTPKIPGFLEGPDWVRGGCREGGPQGFQIQFSSDVWDIPNVELFFQETNDSQKSSQRDFLHFQPRQSAVAKVNAQGRKTTVVQASLEQPPLPKKPIPRTTFLEFDARQLSYPSAIVGEEPRLEATGANLASVLAYLNLSQPDQFQRINDALSSVVQTIKRIRFRRTNRVRKFGQDGHASGTFEELLFDTATADGVPARFVSQGTLLVLASLTALMRESGPQIVLLDGIELALHPMAQVEAIQQFKTLLKRFPNIQLIATTHSPYLLDFLEPQEIRLTAVGADGEIQCRRLMEHPDFERWKDEMAPGEMWSVFGEKWLTPSSSSQVAAP